MDEVAGESRPRARLRPFALRPREPFDPPGPVSPPQCEGMRSEDVAGACLRFGAEGDMCRWRDGDVERDVVWSAGGVGRTRPDTCAAASLRD